MYGSKPIGVYLGNQRYSGWWMVENGEVKLSSAYGSAHAKAGRRKPEKVAEELLKGVLEKRRA